MSHQHHSSQGSEREKVLLRAMGSEVGGCNILMRESEARKNTKLQGGYRNSQTFHHVNFFKIIFAELNYFLLVFRLGILNSRNKIKFIKTSGNIDM